MAGSTQARAPEKVRLIASMGVFLTIYVTKATYCERMRHFYVPQLTSARADTLKSSSPHASNVSKISIWNSTCVPQTNNFEKKRGREDQEKYVSDLKQVAKLKSSQYAECDNKNWNLTLFCDETGTWVASWLRILCVFISGTYEVCQQNIWCLLDSIGINKQLQFPWKYLCQRRNISLVFQQVVTSRLKMSLYNNPCFHKSVTFFEKAQSRWCRITTHRHETIVTFVSEFVGKRWQNPNEPYPLSGLKIHALSFALASILFLTYVPRWYISTTTNDCFTLWTQEKVLISAKLSM